nr:hypothetical protein [Tanacetum cinerariifolium]
MLAIQAEEGEGSGHSSEPQPPPSTVQPSNEEPIPNVVSSPHQKTQTPRQALNKVTELPQTSEPIPNVADEVVYEEWDDRVEKAATTIASLDVEQASGIKDCSRFGDYKGRFDDETNFDGGFYKVQVNPTQVSAHGEAHSQEDQPEDQLGVLSAAKYCCGVISTASRLFSTAGASMPVSTAGMVQEVYISITSPVAVKDKDRLGHEATVRLQEELDKEERQMMARVHEAAQSFTEEEWENIRARIKAGEELAQRLQEEEKNKYSEVDQAKMLVDLNNQRKRYFAAQKAKAKRNKPMTQAQQRTYMSTYIKNTRSYTLNQLKKLSFDEIKKLFETTMKRVNTFVPMKIEVRGRASELAAESSQATITDSAEDGSSKRAAEAKLDYEGSKRQKTNEASGSVREQPDEEENELVVGSRE